MNYKVPPGAMVIAFRDYGKVAGTGDCGIQPRVLPCLDYTAFGRLL